jgi:hypothetical protein
MNAPKLEELLTLSRKKDRNKQTKRLVFAHGAVLFSARKRKNRIEIEVDCWGTRNLLPAVQSQLADRHSEYLSDHPDVKLGGAATSFGPSGCRCHVAPEHADHWLELLFGVVSNEANLASEVTPEEAMRKAWDDVTKGA